jgi:hypothetical protein
MEPKTFTSIEVVQILNDARACATRRSELGIINPDEARGWGIAINNIAERFGVGETYVNGPALELDVRDGI